ncbi:MAG: efflux RND transporter periplasmic adaptor subunit [Acidobacteriota bacterium]|nr:MAG: efflux RND transporter periplasmic adaptor subunit [Acidobacteriota bacterium]
MHLRATLRSGAAVVLGLALEASPAPLAQSPSAEDRPAGSAPALPVRVVTVTPRPLTERLATTGTVRANESVDVVSEIAGIAKRITFEEGAPVARGELLLKIDDTELRAEYDRVRHRVHLSELREKRQRELREQGIVSEQEYDFADTELNVLRAEMRLVDAELAKTEIRAPFAGVVGLRHVSEGSLLSPQTRIVTLRDLDPVKIDFTLPERYASRVTPGTEVDFRVKGSDRTFKARVYAVEPQISPETRSLTIRARTPNPDGVLLPGAFADVTVAVNEIPEALVVPSLAVVPELGGKKIFVVEDGVVQTRHVETGIRTADEVQITSGLAPGDRVIVSAIQRLRPGLAVDPAEVEGSVASR